jgi:hypothetical protein
LYTIVEQKQLEVSQAVIGPLNTITKYQEDYVQTFRKLDLVINKIDGYKLDTGEFKVYSLDNNISETPGDVFGKMKEIYPIEIAKQLTDYNNDIKSSNIINPSVIEDKGKDFIPQNTNLFKQPNDEFNRRFYMVMSDVFVDKNKYDTFVESLLTDQVNGNSDLVKLIKETCESLRAQYIQEYDSEKKIFTTFESSDTYNKYKNFKIDEFNTKVRYTTQKDNTTKDKRKLLKNTYSDLNVNKDRKTFNGKITFN